MVLIRGVSNLRIGAFGIGFKSLNSADLVEFVSESNLGLKDSLPSYSFSIATPLCMYL